MPLHLEAAARAAQTQGAHLDVTVSDDGVRDNRAGQPYRVDDGCGPDVTREAEIAGEVELHERIEAARDLTTLSFAGALAHAQRTIMTAGIGATMPPKRDRRGMRETE
jgi:hypothetical protein